ncbi:MAG TPA: hypothetical protein DDX57_10525 [Bacteroidales bacterium]|nr:MAG: hypothetical protein A2W94_07030 [Bacteroidetes bacterium GWE2_42_42]HBG71210.1 hypothetical protein [Bacteroidales bacterium]
MEKALRGRAFYERLRRGRLLEIMHGVPSESYYSDVLKCSPTKKPAEKLHFTMSKERFHYNANIQLFME